MKKNISIGRYIAIQVTILILVLVSVYSLTINQVYQWGVHDTTHYYLSLEADWVAESIEVSGQLPRALEQDSQYYFSQSELPESLKTLFPLEQHVNGEMLTDETNGVVTYLLPYKSEHTGQLFYISSTYIAKDDEYEVDLEISDLQLLLLLFVVIIVFLLVRNLAWSIISPIRHLDRWAASVSQDGQKTLSLASLEFKFAELQTVADHLNDAVSTIEENNQKEKSFLQTLSHELRTPLAITKAALDLLQKDNTKLDKVQLLKIERMRRANDNMLSTSECLLWLWTGNQTELPKQAVNLYKLADEAITTNQYLLRKKPVEVVLEIPFGLVIDIEKKLAKIVIQNLIRNAFQYTEQGTIKITANSQGFKITNPLTETSVEQLDSNQDLSADADYGYGVGLYLVKKICSHQDWSVNFNDQSSAFSVSVSFTPQN